MRPGEHISLLGAFCIILLASFGAARAAAEERDPFFSAGPRSAVSATSRSDESWGRDPFSRPFEGAVPASTAPGGRARGKGLTGIIFSANVRLAIMNGETVHEGGMIDGKKVAEIRGRSIVLMNSFGSREELSLEDFSIRK